MLLLKKYTDPRETILFASYLMLKELKKKRIITMQGLQVLLSKNIQSYDFLFMPTLNCLYALGKIKYHAKTDTIEFIEN